MSSTVHVRDEHVVALIKARLADIEEVEIDSDGARRFRCGPDTWLSPGALAQSIEYDLRMGEVAYEKGGNS